MFEDIARHIEASGILNAKNPLIVMLGPTGSGKTTLSIKLCKRYHGEVVSADSRQVYRGMDIGTAKITPEEMEGVAHHLIDVAYPDEDFSTGKFKTQAERAFEDIKKRGNIPFLVGGTMLWIDAVVYNFAIPEKTDFVRAKKYSLEEMRDFLEKHDPETFHAIDLKNPRRIERAFLYVKETGTSYKNAQKKDQRKYDALLIGLSWKRELLYARLNARVDEQIAHGLIEETRTLSEQFAWGLPAMSSIGYKQIGAYLREEMTLEDAVEKLKTANRNYAKRQMTWWKRNPDIAWFPMDKGEMTKTL
jgi:tRNA dimethylallyltransferase